MTDVRPTSGGTTIALLWIGIAVATWIALYQGTVVYITRPPAIDELLSVKGRIARVDTPVPRNRNEPYSELAIELSPARVQRVVVRHDSLSRQELEALEGRQAEAKYAGRRPRNRWVYDLVVDGQPMLTLEREIQRDDAVRRNALGWAVGNSALALLGLAAIARVYRRRRRAAMQNERPAA